MNNSKTTKSHKFILRTMNNFFLLIVAVIILTPLFWVVMMSLKTNAEVFTEPMALPSPPQWINYPYALALMNLPVLLKNTLFAAFISIGGGMFMAALSSFAISRMKFGSNRIQSMVYTYFISGVIIPSFVLLFPIYIMNAKINALDTLWAIILPYLGWTAPMATLIMVGAFNTIPSTMDDAAAIDGCGAFRIFFLINLPLVMPALATCFIVCFLGIWNEFPVSSVMLNSPKMHTVALAASMFKGRYAIKYAQMAAGIVILTVPQLAVFTFFQRYIIDGISTGAVKE